MEAVSDDFPGKPAAPVHLVGGGWPLLLLLATVQFTHVLDFMIMMPLGPRYQHELGLTPQQFGFLVSAYAFSACASGLVAAFVVDRFDRKLAVLTLYAGFALSTVGCAAAYSFGTLLLARALAGAFGGVLGSLTLAVIGDVFPENRRGLATGVVMSAFSFATIAGLPAGLELAEAFGTRAPFAVLGGVSLAVLLLAGWLLPSLHGHLADRHNPLAHVSFRVLLHPAHLRAYALMVFLILGMFMLVPYLPTFMIVNVKRPEGDLKWVYLCGGAGTLLTMSVFGRLADRFGKLPVFRIMATLTMVPLLVLTHMGPSDLATWLAVTTAFMIISSGRMVPAMAMITSSARPAYRGSFMSVVGAVQQASAGLASLVGGVLLTQETPDSPLHGYGLVGILACVTIVASVVLGGYVRPVGLEDAVPEEALAAAAELAPGMAPSVAEDAVQGPSPVVAQRRSEDLTLGGAGAEA